MYPEWRRIVDIDERHLGTIGLDRAAVRAELGAARCTATSSAIASLERESGFPRVRRGARRRCRRAGAGRSRCRRAVAQIGPAIDQLREPFAAELAALERPDDAERLAADLGGVRARLAALDDADASWSVRLEDEFAALRTRIEFAFQGQMRHVVREAQDEIERIDPARDWPRA